MHSFRSDNGAGLCPEALRAIADAATGHCASYGDDSFTAGAVAEVRRIFGPEASPWFLATGTAANVLAIAALTRPWQQVICHAHSHCNDDESTAPERLTGCRVVPVAGDSGKLTPRDVARAGGPPRGVHQPQPGALTLSNPTEFGTVYSPEETAAISAAAHAAGYRVHVDGARLANAVAALGCDPRALTAGAGVDALSFGGTKNGLAAGEAVVFFPQGDRRAFEEAVAAFPFHRKSAGHLLSKQRFVTAPFAAVLRGGAWLRHAAHANAMARRLGQGLERLGYRLRFPVEANGVFIEVSARADEALRARGHAYYRFGDPGWNVIRLMCSFDTSPDDVDAFLADAAAASR